MNQNDLIVRMKKQIDNSEYLVATISKRSNAKALPRKTVFGIFSRARRVNDAKNSAKGLVDDIINQDILLNPSYLAAQYREISLTGKPITKFIEAVKQGLANPTLKSDAIVDGFVAKINGAIVKRRSIPTFTPAKIIELLESEYKFKTRLASGKYTDYNLDTLSLFSNYQVSPFSVKQENDTAAQTNLAHILKQLKYKVEYGDVSECKNCAARVEKGKIIVSASFDPEKASNSSNILRTLNILYAIANEQKKVFASDLLQSKFPDGYKYYSKLPEQQKSILNAVVNDISNLLVACNMAKYIYDAETYSIIETTMAIKIACKLKFLQDTTLNKYVATLIESNFQSKQNGLFEALKMDLLTAVNGYESKGIIIHNKENITMLSQLLVASQDFKGIQLTTDKVTINEETISQLTTSKQYLAKLIQLKANFEIEFLSVEMKDLLDETARKEYMAKLNVIATKEIQDVQDRIDELTGKSVSDEEVLSLSSALLLRDLIQFEVKYVQERIEEYEKTATVVTESEDHEDTVVVDPSALDTVVVEDSSSGDFDENATDDLSLVDVDGVSDTE